MSVNAILRITAAESDQAEEQREQRWRRGRPAGSGEHQSPEDGGYLLLLAAARQRGGSAPQTIGGDLKLLTATVATELVCQTPAPAAETTYTTVRSFGLESSVVLLSSGS